jgi:hypothetical protein
LFKTLSNIPAELSGPARRPERQKTNITTTAVNCQDEMPIFLRQTHKKFVIIQ